MARYYVSSAGWTAVTTWAALTAYSSGAYRRQLAGVAFGNERVFKVTTPGTSGAAEPTWNLGAGATTTDGTVTWTECTGAEAEQTNGGAWNAPAANCQLYLNQSTGRAASGDFVFVRSDNAETNAGALTYAKSLLPDPVYIYCVQSNCSIPPVTADLTTGATISTTGAANINLWGRYWWRGIKFQAGSAGNTGSINIGVASGAGPQLFDTCAFKLNNTSVSSVINLGNSGSVAGAIELNNTTMEFGSTSQKITFTNVYTFLWKNTASAILGSIPATFFTLGSAVGPMVFDGVDLSALTGNIVQLATGSTLSVCAIQMQNCRLNSAATLIAGTSQLAGEGSYFNLDNCTDSTGGETYRMVRATVGGNGPGIVTDAQMAPTGGATNGVTQFSWKAAITVGGNVSITPAFPWFTPWISVWNTTLSSRTITIEVLCDKAAKLSAAKLWIETRYLAAANNPLATFATTQSNQLSTTTPTAGTASTKAWNSGTLASRANSTGYSLGDYRKVSTASGLVFKCTTAGTSAGSIPAGYATAVDGDAITDGSAVFTALYRQKLSATVTPGFTGWLSARVCYQDTTSPSNPIWVDPLMTIT